MNILPVFLIAACMLNASCAPLPLKGPLPDVPLVPAACGKAFPDIPHDTRAGTYTLKCHHGYYTDTLLEKSELKYTHGNDVQADPQGKGKIHTRYAIWWNGYRYYYDPEYWGYTFTIHTSEDGVITACSATQQLLEKK